MRVTAVWPSSVLTAAKAAASSSWRARLFRSWTRLRKVHCIVVAAKAKESVAAVCLRRASGETSSGAMFCNARCVCSG